LNRAKRISAGAAKCKSRRDALVWSDLAGKLGRPVAITVEP
jgi:hypothetical protein